MAMESLAKKLARDSFDQAMNAGNDPFFALENLLRDKLSLADFRTALRLLDAIDNATITAFDGATA